VYFITCLIQGRAAGQGTVFGFFVLNRVYNFYHVSVVNRVCILSFVLGRDLKWRCCPTQARYFKAFFVLLLLVKQVQGCKPSAAALYPNIG